MLKPVLIHGARLDGQTLAKGRNGWFKLQRIAVVIYEPRVRHGRLHLELRSRRAGRGEVAPIIVEFGEGDLERMIQVLEQARESLAKEQACEP